MSRRKHHHKILILSFIVLTITICVSFLYNKGYLNESPVKLPLIIPTKAPLWNEFESRKNNFKISYPGGWKFTQWDFFEVTDLTTIPDGSIRFQLSAVGSEGKFELLVWENRSKMEVNSWVSEFLHEEIDRKNIPKSYNFTFKGKDSLRITNFSLARNKTVEYIFLNDETRIFELIFELDGTGKANTIYDKIKEDFEILQDANINNEAQTVVNLAKKDLSEKKNVSTAEIKLLTVKKVQWSDSSLGCAKPGQMYLQVITPGFEISLSAKGANYIYHTDLEKRVVLCLES